MLGGRAATAAHRLTLLFSPQAIVGTEPIVLVVVSLREIESVRVCGCVSGQSRESVCVCVSEQARVRVSVLVSSSH